MMKGSGRLSLFIIRCDWPRMLIWIAVLAALAAVVPLALNGIFGSDAERSAMAQTMENPAMTALFGKGYGFDNYNIGAMMANEMLLFTMIIVAIANIMLVVRHTRKAEDLGRFEMILALPVGRLANMIATLLVAFLFNLVIVVLQTVIFTAIAVESMPFVGNLYFSLCLGVTGLFFAAITTLFVQIANSSRAAIGISLTFFGITYMMRAVGDLGNEVLSLVSPLGLPLRSKPYVDETLWPLVVMVAASFVLVALAALLQARRDMNSGLVPQLPGKSAARKSLLSPLGLAWRLNRGMFVGWAIGMFCFGAMYGSVFGNLESFINSSDFLKTILSNSQFSLTEQFVAMLMVILSVVATIPSAMLALRVWAEEKSGKLSHLVALSVSRFRLMTSSVVLAFASSVVMMFLASLGLWVSSNAVMSDPIPFTTFMAAGLSYIPAILVVCGLAIALTGCLPKLTAATWILLAYGFFSGYVARLMQLDDWVSALSPFFYVKQLPVQEFDALPLVVLSLVAIALVGAGYIGFKKRDLQA